MKSTKKLFSLLLICVFVVGLAAILVSMRYDDISDWLNNENGGAANKVRFEGIDSASNESYSQIADAFNETGMKIEIVIHLNNQFQGSTERPGSDVSLEEAKSLLKQQRASVKEYYTRTNKEYLEELELEKLDIEYSIDEYAPFIFAEFNSEITEEDIAYIYKISRKDSITAIYVKVYYPVEPELADD